MNPADELVIIVDRDNNVVGSATREKMRADRLPHRCAYILVFNHAFFALTGTFCPVTDHRKGPSLRMSDDRASPYGPWPARLLWRCAA